MNSDAVYNISLLILMCDVAIGGWYATIVLFSLIGTAFNNHHSLWRNVRLWNYAGCWETHVSLLLYWQLNALNDNGARRERAWRYLSRSGWISVDQRKFNRRPKIVSFLCTTRPSWFCDTQSWRRSHLARLRWAIKRVHRSWIELSVNTVAKLAINLRCNPLVSPITNVN